MNALNEEGPFEALNLSEKRARTATQPGKVVLYQLSYFACGRNLHQTHCCNRFTNKVAAKQRI